MFRFWNVPKPLSSFLNTILQADLFSTSVQVGEGGLTPEPVGDTKGNRLTPDNEDIWRAVKAESLREYGLRYVENLAQFSEDMTQSNYSATNNAVIDSATQATYDGTTNGTVKQNVTVEDKGAGRTFILTAEITLISGTPASDSAVQLVLSGSAVTFAAADIGSDVSSIPQRFAISTTTDAAGTNISCEVQADSAVVLGITNWQLEESTGRSDTSTPSEYLSTGVGTGGEVFYETDFSSGTDLWTGTRGTAAGDIDDIGSQNDWLRLTLDTSTGDHYVARASLLTSGLSYEVTYTYYIPSTNSHADGLKLGATGSALGENQTVTDTVTTVTEVIKAEGAFLLFVATDGGVTSFTDAAGDDVFYVKDVTVRSVDHGANVDGAKFFTTTNGNSVSNNVVTEATGTAIAASTLKGLFCEGEATEITGFSADFSNWNTNTTAQVAQDVIGLQGNPNEAFTLTDSSAVNTQRRQKNYAISDNSETYHGVSWVKYNASPSVFPLLRVQLLGGTGLDQSVVFDPSDGSFVEPNTDGDVVSVTRIGEFWRVQQSLTNNSSGNTTIAVYLVPAYNADGTVTEDGTVQGSTEIASFEVYNTTPSWSPILTTGGTTKTRLADVEPTLDISNWPDGDVSLEFELTPFFDVSTGAVQGLLTPNSGDRNKFIKFSDSAAKRLVQSDGTNDNNYDSAWSATGDTVKIKIRANATTGKMQMSSDGVAKAEGTYDGSFNPSGAITLFKSLTLGGAMKNLRIWSVDLGEGWLTS